MTLYYDPESIYSCPAPPRGFLQPALLGCSSAWGEGCADVDFTADDTRQVSEAAGGHARGGHHQRCKHVQHGHRRSKSFDNDFSTRYFLEALHVIQHLLEDGLALRSNLNFETKA